MSEHLDFSIAEQYAMRLDGVLFERFGRMLPSDEPDVLENRVRIAREFAPAQYILDGHSAAWVWGACVTPPQRPEFCQIMANRGTDRFGTYRSQRYVRLREGEVVHTRAGDVLSPWRTALHLLRWCPSVNATTVETLLRREQLTLSEAPARIEEELAQNQRQFYLRPLERIASASNPTNQ
ncbi:MAG: hypothetical protein ACKOXM_08170 [Agromyces sp.]